MTRILGAGVEWYLFKDKYTSRIHGEFDYILNKVLQAQKNLYRGLV